MLNTPARLSAAYPLCVATAVHSTGPRTPDGFATSSPCTHVRVSLSHGAYADETLLAGSAAQPSTDASHTPDKNEAISASADPAPRSDAPPQAPAASAHGYRCHDIAMSGPTAASGSTDGGSDLLASFTSHYNPAGPAETLLVRRIVAATLRIDLLERSLDALLELGERRAVVDHLSDRFARDLAPMQVRDQPNWSAMLRRYDGNPGVPPSWGPDPTDDPALDPDPALCTLAYALSSPRAALLMRHEAAAERRLHAAMRELHRLQAARHKQQMHRNKPTMSREPTARNKAIVDQAGALWNEPMLMHPHTTMRNEPVPGLAMHPHATPRNEPTSPAEIQPHAVTRNEPNTYPLDTVRNEANKLPNLAPLDVARDVQFHPDRMSPPPSAQSVGVKNEPIPSPLPDMPAPMSRNEPSMLPPLPTPSSPA